MFFHDVGESVNDADDLFHGGDSREYRCCRICVSRRVEEVENFNEVKVPEGNAFDFDKPLDRLEQGIIQQAILDEVEVVDQYNGGNDEATFE